jgi:hypothetical protein
MSIRSILSGLVCGGLMLGTTAVASAHPQSVSHATAFSGGPAIEQSIASTPWLASAENESTVGMVYAASMQSDEELEELMDAIDELIDALEELQDAIEEMAD